MALHNTLTQLTTPNITSPTYTPASANLSNHRHTTTTEPPTQSTAKYSNKQETMELITPYTHTPQPPTGRAETLWRWHGEYTYIDAATSLAQHLPAQNAKHL